MRIQRETDYLPHCRCLLRKNLVRAVVGGEHVTNRAQTFRSPQHQKTAQPQSVVEKRNRLVLQYRFQVNQHVSATDQVHLRKRRVVEQIMLCENTDISNALADPISRLHFREKSPQPLRRHVALDVLRVNSAARLADTAFAYVRSKKLHWCLVRL